MYSPKQEYRRVKTSIFMKDRIFCFVYESINESTIEKVMARFSLSRHKVILQVKKHPYMYRRRGNEREKIHINSEDKGINLDKDAEKLYIRKSFEECKTALQLIGTYISKSGKKLKYLEFQLIYYEHCSNNFKCILSKNTFYVAQHKVVRFFDASNIRIYR